MTSPTPEAAYPIRRELIRTDRAFATATVRGDDALVICFSFHGTPRPGLGQLGQLDQKHNFAFSIVDVACKMAFPNPVEDITRLIAAVAEFARGYRRVFTFGGSLGGFLALNFASYFGAQTAIAASPPFAFNPAKVKTDTRWEKHTRSVTSFAWDNIEHGITSLENIFVLYDPYNPDAPHIAAIKNVAPHTTLLPIRFGAHPVSKVLGQANNLGPMISQIVDGTFDRASLRRAIVDSRPKSSVYLRTLAAAQPPRREQLRLRLLRKAHEVEPTTANALDMLPTLIRLGRMDEVQAITKAVADADSANTRQVRTLQKENAKLKSRVADLKREIRTLEEDAEALETSNVVELPTQTPAPRLAQAS
jgi:hypothetical protein